MYGCTQQGTRLSPREVITDIVAEVVDGIVSRRTPEAMHGVQGRGWSGGYPEEQGTYAHPHNIHEGLSKSCGTYGQQVLENGEMTFHPSYTLKVM